MVSVVVLIIELVIITFNFNNKYDQNIFTVNINDNQVHLYYKEFYQKTFIPYLFDARKQTTSFNSVEFPVNQIDYADSIKLYINEYSVYNDNGKQVTLPNWYFNENKYKYIKRDINDCQLIIKRLGNVLYQDECVSELGDFLTSPGRYFFQVILTRHENFYTNIKTHMNFNVIVKGEESE